MITNKVIVTLQETLLHYIQSITGKDNTRIKHIILILTPLNVLIRYLKQFHPQVKAELKK